MISIKKKNKKAIASELYGNIFKVSTDIGKCFDNTPRTGALATNSTLVSTKSYYKWSGNTSDVNTLGSVVLPSTLGNMDVKNVSVVTEHFLKVLDKVYAKLWNESINENALYVNSNLVTIYHAFFEDSPSDFMSFKNFVSRCISAGILTEDDRLMDDDQITITGLKKSDISYTLDVDNNLLSFNINYPAKLAKVLNGASGQYLNGKKLYILVTPLLPNQNLDNGGITNSSVSDVWNVSVGEMDANNRTLLRYSAVAVGYTPYTSFKPKSSSSKFGAGILLPSHFIWSIGTPEDKENALIDGTPVPDIIFDHTDKISHFDKLTLKIKIGKVTF